MSPVSHNATAPLRMRTAGTQLRKGDTLTEQNSRHTPFNDDRQSQHHGLFRAADEQAEDRRHPAARSSTPNAVTNPSWDVFSHASEYDVAEQERPVTQHDDVAMRSLRLPSEAEADADVVDTIDQRRSVPIDEDDYR